MPAFLLSTKALEDLKSIGRFTQKSWDREQRNIYLSKLDESFHLLAEQPSNTGLSKTAKSCIALKYRKWMCDQ